jgi:hypothetical protein
MRGLAAELRGARLWMNDATAMFVCVRGTWPYTCRRSNTMYGLQHVTNTAEIQALLAPAYTPLLPWGSLHRFMLFLRFSKRRLWRSGLLSCNAAQFRESPMFRRNISPLHSGSLCLPLASCLAYSSILKMQVIYYSEKSVDMPGYIAYIPENIILYGHRCENHKSNN